RSLEIDHQLESGGLLDGEIRGLRAFEDLVHVGRGAPGQIRKVRSIGHEAPGIDKLPQWVHRRQPVLCREGHEVSSLADEERSWPTVAFPQGAAREQGWQQK